MSKRALTDKRLKAGRPCLEAMSLEDVAKKLGITKSAVWQTEKKALRKLRVRLLEWARTNDPRLALRLQRGERTQS